ncbi:MAG: hypothetical protein HKL80_06265 [Acidimicrobiales bacterium]|nr:hypothetical protein [Acidimicrobiales bacterium]
MKGTTLPPHKRVTMLTQLPPDLLAEISHTRDDPNCSLVGAGGSKNALVRTERCEFSTCPRENRDDSVPGGSAWWRSRCSIATASHSTWLGCHVLGR